MVSWYKKNEDPNFPTDVNSTHLCNWGWLWLKCGIVAIAIRRSLALGLQSTYYSVLEVDNWNLMHPKLHIRRVTGVWLQTFTVKYFGWSNTTTEILINRPQSWSLKHVIFKTSDLVLLNSVMPTALALHALALRPLFFFCFFLFYVCKCKGTK